MMALAPTLRLSDTPALRVSIRFTARLVFHHLCFQTWLRIPDPAAAQTFRRKTLKQLERQFTRAFGKDALRASQTLNP